ncbi:hypothetical protein PR048_027154 [Dryococelus australis]|uniref:Transposable element P transposase-like GTP-binding insertion domain-containing protein n=1 Tax=Dryococelus australis TaxID=614101 RepID=A0ABQ9GG98_9NEOP|nr:hypothetical protein PR048_027154 [Dryococelus australis]
MEAAHIFWLRYTDDCKSSGYAVTSVTGDMGGSNRSVWKELKINATHSSFPNTCDESRENSLLDMSVQDHKIAFKISQQHLDVSRTQRQKVKTATQLLSNTASKALEFLGRKQLLKEPWQATAHFLKLFNDWFDVLNSSYPFNADNSKLAYELTKLEQGKILSEMDKFICLQRVMGHRNEMKISVSNSCYKQVFKEFVPLFEGKIRSMGCANDHLTSLDFKYRIRWYVLGKHSTSVFTRNRNTTDNNE